MSLMAQSRRLKRSLDILRMLHHPEPGPGADRSGAGIPREDRNQLAFDLLNEPAVQKFLGDFPPEEEPVRAEIARFVTWADRKIAYSLARSERQDEGRRQAVMRELLGSFLARLVARLDRYRELAELMRPFRRYLGSSWDLSSTAIEPAVFDIWKETRKLQRHRRKIRQITELLGRIHELERARRKELLAAARARPAWSLERAGKSTLIGIHESDDLSSLVASEAALLATPETETLFYLKFAEKQLFTYDYRVEEEAAARRAPMRRRGGIRRKGPMILALDTSGSMELGNREQQAKALSLALVRIALRQRRSVHLMSFSGDVETLTLAPPRASLRELLGFLMLSFHGGTDARGALDQALPVMKAREFRRADLIFVTDAEAQPFRPDQVDAMAVARRQGTRFYALVVGQEGEPELLKQVDHGWRYDGSNLNDLVLDFDRYRRRQSTPGRPSLAEEPL